MNPVGDWNLVTLLGVGQSQHWMLWQGPFLHDLQNDEAKILYHGLSECALLSFEREQMLLKDVEDQYCDGMVLFPGMAAENEDVVHIDDYHCFIDEFSEDVINNHLEHLHAVSETKEYE